MRCSEPFWSEDVVRLCLCDGDSGCRDRDSRFAQGETGGSYGRFRD